ncbi:hypothetical protein BDZ89DRAFT_994410 [Hymenopellis radicata]|nr:hypothetical protein BDZ89DRAFT_994410 [Hymenopellis radicata]
MIVQHPSLWIPPGLAANGAHMDNDFRIIQVGNALFNVHTPTLFPLSPSLAKEIRSTKPGCIARLSNPPPSPKHFEAFLLGVYKERNPKTLQMIGLPDIILVAEMSFHYGNISGAFWAMEGVRTAVFTTENRPLRFASAEIFVRLLKLAFICDDDTLSHSVQSQWLSRLFRRELSPIPAIEMGSRESGRLQHLLSHAYYVHMVSLEPILSAAQRIEPHSPLTRAQNVHVRCGYHSLSVYASKIRARAPSFRRGKGCASHADCTKVWRASWIIAMSRASSVPDIDILQRMKDAAMDLGKDPLIGLAMYDECRTNALRSIGRGRDMISKHLHHHFDL